MTIFNNTWTNQLYHLADFLYWEPQHINRQKRKGGDMVAFEKAMEQMHSLEVPLNILFNITMRLAPQRIKRTILNCFDVAAEFGSHIESTYIYNRLNDEKIYFIQPDAVVESETAIVCIELKLRAQLSLNQVYKYLSLLGMWQTKMDIPKAPCLLLLTQKDLRAQWDSKEREKIFSGDNHLAALEYYLKSSDPPRAFAWNSVTDNHYERIKATLRDVHLGWASWQDVGNALSIEWQRLNQATPTESEEMLDILLGDFLAELEQRRLWQRYLSEPIDPNNRI